MVPIVKMIEDTKNIMMRNLEKRQISKDIVRNLDAKDSRTDHDNEELSRHRLILFALDNSENDLKKKVEETVLQYRNIEDPSSSQLSDLHLLERSSPIRRRHSHKASGWYVQISL